MQNYPDFSWFLPQLKNHPRQSCIMKLQDGLFHFLGGNCNEEHCDYHGK